MQRGVEQEGKDTTDGQTDGTAKVKGWESRVLLRKQQR